MPLDCPEGAGGERAGGGVKKGGEELDFLSCFVANRKTQKKTKKKKTLSLF
jgi:hypothetical protein